jgi:predicted nucleotidyltransferase
MAWPRSRPYDPIPGVTLAADPRRKNVTYWQVEEKLARGTVRSARSDIDEIVEFAPTMTTRFEAAVTACDHLEIGSALDDVLLQCADPLLQAVVGSGGNICSGTTELINAIVDADLTMAADAEREVYSIPDAPAAGLNAEGVR